MGHGVLLWPFFMRFAGPFFVRASRGTSSIACHTSQGRLPKESPLGSSHERISTTLLTSHLSLQGNCI